jgi:hypothetical protein
LVGSQVELGHRGYLHPIMPPGIVGAPRIGGCQYKIVLGMRGYTLNRRRDWDDPSPVVCNAAVDEFV